MTEKKQFVRQLPYRAIETPNINTRRVYSLEEIAGGKRKV